MFEIGDYVLNATNGICKISEIVELDMSGDKQLKSYFLLRPVEEENDRVYIPVDNADKRIRKVITQDEALAVLDRVPEIEALAVNNEKERETRYKEAVSFNRPLLLLRHLPCYIRHSCICIKHSHTTQASNQCTPVQCFFSIHTIHRFERLIKH